MTARQRLRYFDAPERLALRLRAAREEAGLSQRELAFPGCSAGYLSRLEAAERVPSLQLLQELARRLAVSCDYLAWGRHSPSARSSAATEARVALRLGDQDGAGEIVAVALGAAGSDRERAELTALLAEIALQEGEAERAIELFEQAASLEPELEQRDPQAAEALGRAYARAFRYEEAIAVFVRNRDRARATEDPLNAVRFASLLANCHIDRCDFAAAEAALGEAIRISEQISDPLTRARMLWSQSRLHAHQNDPQTAAAYAERALAILEESDHSYYAALAHQLLAHIELDRGNGERAAALLEQAAPLVEASGRRFEATSFRIEQARALLATGERERAGAVAMRAAAEMRELSQVDAGRAYQLLADVFLQLDDTERAIELYELAIELLRATPNRYLVDAYRQLAELHEGRGDPEAALAVYKQAMTAQLAAGRSLTGAHHGAAPSDA